jgi:hypothetical protein
MYDEMILFVVLMVLAYIQDIVMDIKFHLKEMLNYFDDIEIMIKLHNYYYLVQEVYNMYYLNK